MAPIEGDQTGNSAFAHQATEIVVGRAERGQFSMNRFAFSFAALMADWSGSNEGIAVREFRRIGYREIDRPAHEPKEQASVRRPPA